MPPDPSTQSVHQADPFATLALRPGWLVSRLGIAARTGLDAEVTAYSIVFWLHDALPAQDMIAWQEQKAASPRKWPWPARRAPTASWAHCPPT